jgi:hypothetical protein
MGAIFNVFPLILIPVLTYNIWAFGATAANNGDGAQVRQHLADAWIRMPMASARRVDDRFRRRAHTARAHPALH